MTTYIIEHPSGAKVECYLAHYEAGKILTFKDLEEHVIIFCASEGMKGFEEIEKAFLKCRESGGDIGILEALAKGEGVTVEYIKFQGSMDVVDEAVNGENKYASQSELSARCERIN